MEFELRDPYNLIRSKYSNTCRFYQKQQLDFHKFVRFGIQIKNKLDGRDSSCNFKRISNQVSIKAGALQRPSK